jgi:NodT family efflux transporter outer membrane factor (OMF) lipoprotein
MKEYINLSGILAALLLALAGCRAVGPDYTEPEWSDPDLSDLKTHAGSDISAKELALWWQVFDDPVLTNLVERALCNNLTLADSLAQIREARARLGMSKAGLLPEVDAGGSYQRFRNSGNAGIPGDGDHYQAGFDARWELDIFGRQRRSVEAAEAAFQASCATFEHVWVVVAAETAMSYVKYQELQKRIAVAQENLELQGDTLEILVSRAEAGIGDDLAVEQARYNLERTRATIPGLQSSSDQALNALAVLTGVMPGELDLKIARNGKVLSAPVRTITGIPAAALRHRPDVRAAERQLAARCAEIGVSEADLYPTFALGGSIGLESLDSGDFFKSDSRFYSLGPTFSWPLFRGGSIRANIEVKKALHEQAFINYEATVLDAVAELRNVLSAYVREYERLESLQKAAEAARNAVAISQDKYRQGLADFNSVLDAQRSLLTFEELVVISQGLTAGDLIGIYKALGGGWEPLGE